MFEEPVAICAVMVGGVRRACVLRKFHVGDVVSHAILKRCRRRLTPALVTLRPRVALCACVWFIVGFFSWCLSCGVVEIVLSWHPWRVRVFLGRCQDLQDSFCLVS